MIWSSIELLSEFLHQYRREHPAFYAPARYRVVCTSGGFDPLHCGHVRLLQESKRFGGLLLVVVNGDGFLQRKKGFFFLSLAERLEIVHAIQGVDHVVGWDDGSQFVDGALRLLRPDAFTKGGDRSAPEFIADCEMKACMEVGCSIIYGVGGAKKVQSSSALVERVRCK